MREKTSGLSKSLEIENMNEEGKSILWLKELDIELALKQLQSRKSKLESKDQSLKSALFHEFLLKTRDAKLMV